MEFSWLVVAAVWFVAAILWAWWRMFRDREWVYASVPTSHRVAYFGLLVLGLGGVIVWMLFQAR